MKVVITGGTGFIGLNLARQLLARNALTGASGGAETIDEMVLFDAVVPDRRPDGLDQRVVMVGGDVADRDQVFALLDRDDISVFHLASVVSAGGEQDFDLAMRVNLEGGLNILEACRARATCSRIVFASSIATYGGPAMPEMVGDETRQTPETTYGATKAIGELLINDYTRKGFLDGRTARLPTVIIRPGKPNKAASGFASGVFREPLNGEAYDLPVGLETRMPVLGHRAIVACLTHLHEVDGAALGLDRVLNLPALAVTVAEMIDSLKRVAAEALPDVKLGEIRMAPDPDIQAIVAGWPTRTKFERAQALGMPEQDGLDSIVKDYIGDFLSG